MTFEQLQTGVTMIVLDGRLDIKNAMAIDLQFAAVAAANRAVIVDLREVEFIASMGLRTLILGAKSMHTKNGRMALLAPRPDVQAVLQTSGVDTLIPIAPDLETAERMVLG